MAVGGRVLARMDRTDTSINYHANGWALKYEHGILFPDYVLFLYNTPQQHSSPSFIPKGIFFSLGITIPHICPILGTR